jgi:hypothetical protein
MVPFSITILEAAAPRTSLAFIFWGAGVFVLPLMLIYTITAYSVFRARPARAANTIELAFVFPSLAVRSLRVGAEVAIRRAYAPTVHASDDDQVLQLAMPFNTSSANASARTGTTPK